MLLTVCVCIIAICALVKLVFDLVFMSHIIEHNEKSENQSEKFYELQKDSAKLLEREVKLQAAIEHLLEREAAVDAQEKHLDSLSQEILNSLEIPSLKDSNFGKDPIIKEENTESVFAYDFETSDGLRIVKTKGKPVKKKVTKRAKKSANKKAVKRAVKKVAKKATKKSAKKTTK